MRLNLQEPPVARDVEGTLADADGQTSGRLGNTLPVYTYDQIAFQLTDGFWDWAGISSRSFDMDANGGVLTFDVSRLTPEGQALARAALQSWSEATGIIFQEVTPGNVINELADAPASSATSYVMSVGDRFNGTLQTAGDRDWVAVNLQAGETYVITLNGTSTLQDTYLRLYAPNGTTLLAENDDVAVGILSSSITFTPSVSGTYYVSAGSYNDLYSGAYTLDVNTEDGFADIVFDDSDSGAYSTSVTSGSTILSSFVNISTAWLAAYGTGLNSYSYQTYLHEIGHALGLGHAGNYNGAASYPADALYANDSWQATLMSYFSQTENTYIDASEGFTLTPMIADYIAIQNLYGVPTTTRSGDTTYGDGNSTGNSVYDLVGTGVLTIFDSGGTDTINLASRTEAQRLNLAAESISDINGRVGNLSIARGTVIENAITGSGNDSIYGQGADNYIAAGDGNDVIQGYGGNDTILGEGGNDTANGGTGDDEMYAGGGSSNFLIGDAGNDSLYGGDGYDLLYGGIDNDSIVGGRNSDEIFGEDGDDVLYGEDGFDYIAGGTGNDLIYGGNGNDRLLGGNDHDTLWGGTGNDTVWGGPSGNDILRGEEGDDVMYGEAGADWMHGGIGNDTLIGGNGFDTMIGGEGNDSLDGGLHADFVYGGIGNDVLAGGEGDDEIYGEAGADVLDGGFGNDLLAGGADNDTFVFVDGFGNDTIRGFDATSSLEVIDLSGVAAIVDWADLQTNHMVQAGADVIISDGLGNTITVQNVSLADLDASDFLF